MSRSRAFTLVELLVVIVILAILASITVPKFQHSSLLTKEAALRANLRIIRKAGDRCEAGTGLTVDVTDLVKSTPPATGWKRGPINSNWPMRPLNPTTWKLEQVPIKPLLGTNRYVTGGGDATTAWAHYSNQNFNPYYYYYPSIARSSNGSRDLTW